MARNGLIVTYYFPPAGGGGVQRWIKLIKYLSRLDWEFTVIAAPTEEKTPQDDSLLEDLPDTTEIIRIPSRTASGTWSRRIATKMSRTYFQRWMSSWFYITDSRSNWNSAAAVCIKEQLGKKKFDVVIFTLPPYSVALLAAVFSNETATPVGLDMRDPWTINPYKIYPTSLHRWLDRRRERKVILKVDFLISAYQSVSDHFKETIPQFDQIPFLLLPNGYDEEDFQHLPAFNLLVDGDLHLAFSGSFYSHLNGPDTIFEAMKILKRQGLDIHFHHLGTSVYDASRLASKFGLGAQFHSWGYQTHRECLTILNSMDGFVLSLDETVRHADKTVGGKLYEYLRLKKPVIAIVPEHGEAARIIRETDSGVVCSRFHIDALVRTVKELHDRKRKFTFNNIEQYNRLNQTIRLNQFLEERIKSNKQVVT